MTTIHAQYDNLTDIIKTLENDDIPYIDADRLYSAGNNLAANLEQDIKELKRNAADYTIKK